MADSTTTDLTYTPTTWADGADGGTAITADRLNNIEHGVAAATKQVNANTKGIKALGDSVSQLTGGLKLIRGSFQAFVPAGTTKATVVRDSAVYAAWANPQTSWAGAVTCTAQWTGTELTIYVRNELSSTWSGNVTWFALV